MELEVAVRLIVKGVSQKPGQVWLDLGAGQGLFTEALASLLQPESTIYAIDRQSQDYSSVQRRSQSEIHFLKQDFTAPIKGIEKVDGILMANALHFVRDKTAFMKGHVAVKNPATIILVEYDTDTPNTWVPYPLSFETLTKWVREIGVGEVVQIGEAPSRYNGSGMYSAMIRR